MGSVIEYVRAASGIETVTIEGVPLVGTGSYNLSTGPHTFTEEELRDAVNAARDPTVILPRIRLDSGRSDSPRIKLGHDDPREGFSGLDEDGNPTLGVVKNLRLADNGQEVVGDFDGFPEFLREIAAVGYPSLSIEGARNFTAPSGQKYRLVITDVALLGDTAPAVTSIKDLREFFSTAKASSESFVLAAGDRTAGLVNAEMDMESIRDRFYEEQGPPFGPNAKWVRSLRVDDSGGIYLVLSDDGGHTWRVSVTVQGDGVTFSEPEEVTERYVPVAAGMAAPGGGFVLATYESRDRNHHPREGGHMTEEQRRALARRLGQPEDSDEATLLAADGAAAALAAMMAEGPTAGPAAGSGASAGSGSGSGSGDGSGGGGSGSGSGEGSGSGSGESAAERAARIEREAVAAAGGRGVRVLDEDTYQQWEARMRELTEQQERQERERRDQIVARAVEQGRIAPARRSHWRKAFDADPEGTEVLLSAPPDKGGIMPNLIPVIARGAAAPTDEEDAKNEERIMDAYVERYFGNVVARGQRSRQMTRVLHRTEV